MKSLPSEFATPTSRLLSLADSSSWPTYTPPPTVRDDPRRAGRASGLPASVSIAVLAGFDTSQTPW